MTNDYDQNLLDEKIANKENSKLDVWESFNGQSYYGKCFCCTERILVREAHIGYIISISNGGTTQMDNMKPICDRCYYDIGNQNMEQYMITNNMRGLMYLNGSYKIPEYNPTQGRRLKRHEVLQQIINGDPNTLYFSTGPVNAKLYFEMMDAKFKSINSKSSLD